MSATSADLVIFLLFSLFAYNRTLDSDMNFKQIRTYRWKHMTPPKKKDIWKVLFKKSLLDNMNWLNQDSLHTQAH